MSFPVPDGVASAITLPELRLLQRYGHEAGTVLEIGTLYGFSCIGMALAGAHVTSVDPHTEGPGGASTWELFLVNVARHIVPSAMIAADRGQGSVEHVRARIEDIDLAWLNREWLNRESAREYDVPLRSWGMAFIDGDHAAPAPWRDIQIARAHLTSPGYIALHDVAAARWPDVAAAARRLVAEGWRELERAGCLRVYRWRPFGPGRCAICGAPDGIACRTEVHEDYQK